MDEHFKINDIYDKNINFLIGSGASYGLLPTLALNIKDEPGGKTQTIETLATRFEPQHGGSFYTLLFMHYYKTCIEPALTLDMNALCGDVKKQAVVDNYRKFLETILVVLLRRKNADRHCNIFTTNYDGCLVRAADDILQMGSTDFIINDGARGFTRRYLQARNFNSYVYQTGIFERHRTDIPQINLVHLHGSIYWYREGENILVDYSNNNSERLVKGEYFQMLEGFSDVLLDSEKTLADLPQALSVTNSDKDSFWQDYEKLPIVNPTKWKFHETVFEEHYYQMLRLLSYELEKPNTVFLTFGFSFADEHILNLVKRSLSNPSLQLFICCHHEENVAAMKDLFRSHRNVQYLTVEAELNFTTFNEEIFSLDPKPIREATPEGSSDD